VSLVILRDYQEELVERIRHAFRNDHQRVLAVAPTGSGKTVLFSFMTKRATAKGLHVLILAHRGEILDQISETLSEVGVEHGVIRAGHSMALTRRVQVASVQTLVRRLDRITPPDFVVVDEAHHSCAGTWQTLFAKWRTPKWLGVTATPERLDGKGLGHIYGHLVVGPSTDTLIQRGFLAKPVYFAPANQLDVSGLRKTAGDYNKKDSEDLVNRPTITGNAVEHYRRHCNGMRAIVFCVTLKHAREVASQFNGFGIPAATIDGKLDRVVRSSRVKDLSSGKIMVLTSCEIVSEGFDLPSVGAAVLLRPTSSLALHLQQIGRALRPASGKQNAIILDHAGNCLRHGLAEEQRDWTLDGKAKRRRTADASLNTRMCAQCYAIFVGSECPQCGHIFKTRQRLVLEQEGNLKQLSAKDIEAIRERKSEEHACRTLEEYRELGRKRGYKPGWAYFRWKNSWRNKTAA